MLLALGNQAYGDMALNMVLSIKKVSPNVPVHLVWYGNALAHITPDKAKFFDTIEEIPHPIIEKDAKIQYFRAKAFLYELSPFYNTLYLDADMLWLRKPVEEAFELLKDIDFTLANRGGEEIKETTKWLWGNPQDFKAKFQSWLPNFHSEFVWFKKTERVKSYFDAVKDVYDNPPIQPKEFAGGLADEYAYTIASVRTGMMPHKVPFIPTYWSFVDRHRGTGLEYICENHYCYSVGGNAYSHRMKEIYDMLVTANARHFGINGVYKLKTKRSFEPTRMFL